MEYSMTQERFQELLKSDEFKSFKKRVDDGKYDFIDWFNLENEIEKIELFDAGANDYVTKPFSVNELMARIRALLRVSQQLIKPVSTYESESLRIDFQTREVLLENVSVNLTKKEFELLELLVSQEGKLLTQSQIIKRLWGPSHAENTHYLRILVAKLRNKLGDNAIDPKFIFTEPGVGLRFISKPS